MSKSNCCQSGGRQLKQAGKIRQPANPTGGGRLPRLIRRER